MLGSFIQVAIGGAIGAVLRYGVGLWAVRVLGGAFPWATLGVNVFGSFLMGLIAMSLVQSDTRLAPLLMAGLLGGFTTFSAFSLDALTLFERGELSNAVIYVLASVVLSIGALVAGAALARGLA